MKRAKQRGTAEMIRNVTVEHFRGFENLQVSGMSRITLLSGRNNVGKSSLLEALFLMMDHISTDSFAKISGLRGSSAGGIISLWEPLFYQLNTDHDIQICIQDEQSSARLIYHKDNDYLPYAASGVPEDVLAAFRLAAKNNYSLYFTYDHDIYHEEGHFLLNGLSVLREIKTSLLGNEIRTSSPTRWLSPAVFRYSDDVMSDIGNLELKGRKGDVISILQEIDRNIEDVLTLSIQGVTQLYLKIAGKMIPIQYAGDGVLKLLQISLAAMQLQGGLLLIDEIETGFHYSIYGKLWSILDDISARANCQVIATTHSYEMISAVQDNIKRKEDFTYFRIGRGQSGHAAYRYDLDLLNSALESEMEVR